MNKNELIDVFNQHSPTTPMTEEETKIMFQILMSSEPEFNVDINKINKNSEIYKHFKPLIMAFQSQVLLKRLELLTSLKMTLGALIILLHHMQTAGNAVMLAFYMQYKLPKNTLVTLDILSKNLFPWGFFSDEQLHEIWTAQKVSGSDRKKSESDNGIDKVEWWEGVTQ